MGIRHAKNEAVDRITTKTRDERFLGEMRQGLNGALFEAETVLQVVEEVYCPFLDEAAPQVPPGKTSLVAVAADEPAGMPVRDCHE